MDKIDPLTAAKNVYKFVNENERARVLEVVFKPGDVAKMHHHPEHVIYVLKGGELQLTSEGKTEKMKLNQGEAIFLKAQNHEAKNTGSSTVDLLVVELKK